MSEYIHNLPPLPPGSDYTHHLSTLVERVNGFVYPGDRADAIVDVVKVLRADLSLASALLLNPPADLDHFDPTTWTSEFRGGIAYAAHMLRHAVNTAHGGNGHIPFEDMGPCCKHEVIAFADGTASGMDETAGQLVQPHEHP